MQGSEERVRSLLENANDIIYSHDLEGTLTAFNRAGVEITGYSREEILGGLGQHHGDSQKPRRREGSTLSLNGQGMTEAPVRVREFRVNQ